MKKKKKKFCLFGKDFSEKRCLRKNDVDTKRF